MNDKEQVVDQISSTSQPKSRLSYNFLLRMSKRMGTIAARSFVEVKDFLNQEITMSPEERFLAGMPKLRLHKSPDRNQSTARERGAENDFSGPDSNSRSRRGEGEGKREGTDAQEEKVENGETAVDAAKDLKKIISQAHEILAEANTAFPITLFPDTVVVDRTKITIIKRDFFWSSDTMSFRIEDVLNVEVTVGPLFGSLTIASRVMSTTDHFQIKHFWRNDAIRLKRIIQGYVIAQHNKIDVAHLERDELVETLMQLGHERRT